MLVHLNLLCYYDCHTSLTDSAVAVQGCRPWGYPWHPQILADQLALSQPGGSRLCPPNNNGIPGFSNLPTALNKELRAEYCAKILINIPQFHDIGGTEQ